MRLVSLARSSSCCALFILITLALSFSGLWKQFQSHGDAAADQSNRRPPSPPRNPVIPRRRLYPLPGRLRPASYPRRPHVILRHRLVLRPIQRFE